jgi:hypothetical protein
MTATVISMASYVKRKLGIAEDPEEQIARAARDALHAFWGEIARAFPAKNNVTPTFIISEELEQLARLAVRSWIYVNEED